MKDDKYTIALISGLIAAGLYTLSKTVISGIGKVGKIDDFEDLKFVPSFNDILELYKEGYIGTINNGEINFLGNGEIEVSPDIQQKVNLSQTINTLTNLRKAVSFLKKEERGLIFKFATEAEQKDYIRKSKPNVLREAENILNVGEDVTTEEQAYYRTLYAIAKGLKFRWKDDRYTKGVKGELYGGKTNVQGERNARKQYINDKTGITPQRFAESIAAYNSDDYYVLSGILDAIKEVRTPAEAVEVLRGLVDVPFTENNIDVPF